MHFDDDKKLDQSCSLSTFSKSFGEKFKECKLKAWYSARDKNRTDKGSKELAIGKYTHELFAKRISEDFLGKTYNVSSKGIDPTVIYESSVMMERLNLDIIIEKEDKVICVEEFHKVFMKNGLELVGIFDLVLLKDSPKGPYIQVFDLKTGYKVAKEVDLQCMIYTYLAAMTYPGLPILFTTYSVRTGDTWGKFFSEKDALALESNIENFSTEVKLEVESEYKPVANCSPNCSKCPFFDDCMQAQDSDLTNIFSVMRAYQQHKQKTLELEKILKEFRINAKEDKPLEVGEFIVDLSESYSAAIETKKTTKEDLKVLIANSPGGLNEIIDSLDIKLTDKVISLGMKLGISFKPKLSRRIVIKANNEKEEGDADE